ncbi:hypothetical protein GCM10010282_47210 [Streptomyces roseolus]|nr:hypothetical protein GCM10010282_47210 [Streptomyces roseolus]
MQGAGDAVDGEPDGLVVGDEGAGAAGQEGDDEGLRHEPAQSVAGRAGGLAAPGPAPGGGPALRGDGGGEGFHGEGRRAGPLCSGGAGNAGEGGLLVDGQRGRRGPPSGAVTALGSAHEAGTLAPAPVTLHGDPATIRNRYVPVVLGAGRGAGQ